MDAGLSGKVVWITGAAGGIGRELSAAFAAEGARLVLTAHASLERLQQLAAREPWAGDALLAACDVTDDAACERVAAAARARYGRLDVCIANAGAWPSDDVPLARMDPARLRRTLDVNLLGGALTARAFLASLAATGPRADGDGASLVCIGSTAGRFGERDHADYAIAKAGLRGLVATLKNEITRIDPRGRVNLIEPGWTVTAMARPALQDDAVLRRVASTQALRQLGRAVDVAAAAVFLASPRLARHISGETLGVCGGMEGRRLWNDAEIDPRQMRESSAP
jgi:3-oxoacyl-[acyl-carrier protein] reductase